MTVESYKFIVKSYRGLFKEEEKVVFFGRLQKNV